MKSGWIERDAQAAVDRYGQFGHAADFALRVYSTRLLGRDPKLVLHGGGNTSVKTTVKDQLGEDVEVICIKGSGWDMGVIEPAGLPAVRLEPLRKLRKLDKLSDEDMVNFQRINLLDSSAPNPSVETLLHAFLPHKFIDHVHSTAVLALTDQPDNKALVQEVYGTRVAYVPYTIPGFALAKSVADVFDKNPGVGGTWHQNRYPGARVDIPSRVYSHTCAMDYDFDHLFAPQKENERYTNWLADHFGIREHLRLSTEVLSLRWLEESGTWEVLIRNARGEQERLFANAVISAVGFLDRPALAEFPGVKQFKGRIFHTTTFDSTLDLSDKRVAVIGTGASGMQLVPDLQPLVKQLSVFQRSPGWVISMPGYRDPLPEDVRWLDRNVPYYRHWTRFSLAWAFGDHLIYNLWSVDPDWKDKDSLSAANFKVRERLVSYLKEKVGHRPDLVEKLLPKYPPLSKRYVVDNGWFDAVQKENVELITDDPIDHFTETAIVTKSGRNIPIDVAVLATGFRANQFFWPMEIHSAGTAWQLCSRGTPRSPSA